MSSRVPTALRAAASSTWFLGFCVFALTWGGGIVALTTPSLDISLHAGLNLAAQRGFDHGSDVIFTYGPLGFLKSYELFFADTARLAASYGIALHFALATSLVWALRRNFPLAVALALALVTAMFARGDESGVGVRADAAVVILALTWCVAALSRDAPPIAIRVVVYAGGPFAAIELLGKLNTGIIVGCMVGLTVLAIDERRWRNLGTVAAGFVFAAAALWFAAGQGIDDVGPYLSSSLDVISGYTSGARLDWEVRAYDYWLGPVLVATVGALTWIATRGMDAKRRGAIGAIFAVVAYTGAKGGYISHDPYHMAVFYTTLLGMCLVLVWPPGAAVRWLTVAAAAAMIAAAFTTRVPGYPLSNPVENLVSGADTVARLVDSGRLEQAISDARAGAIAAYGLDPRTLALLEGRPVHIDPSETAVVWAHDLDWRPLPVFQPYVAWNASLDQRNADAVASAASGPRRILRQNIDALGRFPGYESPAAMLAMLCNFRALHTTDQWQVLGRVANRCGEPRALASARATYGAPIAIPPTPRGTVVFGRVTGVEDDGLRALASTLAWPEIRQVRFDGGRAWNFVTGTAEDGLIFGAPPEIDFPEPFALAPNAAEVTFLLDGQAAGDEITVDFYAMPVRP